MHLYIYIYAHIYQKIAYKLAGTQPKCPGRAPRMWTNASAMAPRPALVLRPLRAFPLAPRQTCGVGGSPCGPRAHPLWRAMVAMRAVA